MPRKKQKSPLKTDLTIRELEEQNFSYDELFGIANARSNYASRIYDSRIIGSAWADNNPPDPISIELKTEVAAERTGARLGNCPSHYIRGSDSAGHTFAKELYCGQEWCPVCGKKDSKPHLRRFASVLPKAQQLNSLGLMIIEFPLASRNKPRYRKALEYYGKLAVSVLTGSFEVAGKRKRGDMLRRGEVAEIKAKHFSRGMRRWHYFGDVKKELKNLGMRDIFSAEGEVSALVPSVKSNIHLNMLLDAGYIPKPWLLHLVKTLRIAFNEPDLIVHYGYVTEPGSMVHVLKYTTRATFLNYTWDKWLSGQLYGFRNMRSWGVWHDSAVWSLDNLPGEVHKEVSELNIEAINSLGKNRCYKDGLPIIWSRPRCIAELREIPDKIELGAGYYELPGVHPPPAHYEENTAMRWRKYLVQANSRLARESITREYSSSLPDAVMPSLMPDLIDSIHYKDKNLTLASNEDALWGVGCDE